MTKQFEHNIHFFYKRAMASSVTFGDAGHHRERYLKELSSPADVANQLIQGAIR